MRALRIAQIAGLTPRFLQLCHLEAVIERNAFTNFMTSSAEV